MAGTYILKIDSLPVVERGNGIRTTPLVTKEIGAKHITTGLTRFPPGAKVPLHSHNCDEQVTILEGQAEAEIDGQRHRLRPFDTTLVAADKPHRFKFPSRMAEPRCFSWIWAAWRAVADL